MQIIITGQQINLGENLREYADNALTGAVSKYFEEAVIEAIKDMRSRNRKKASK